MSGRHREEDSVRRVVAGSRWRGWQLLEILVIAWPRRQRHAADSRRSPFMSENPLQEGVTRAWLTLRPEVFPVLPDDQAEGVDEQVTASDDTL